MENKTLRPSSISKPPPVDHSKRISNGVVSSFTTNSNDENDTRKRGFTLKRFTPVKDSNETTTTPIAPPITTTPSKSSHANISPPSYAHLSSAQTHIPVPTTAMSKKKPPIPPQSNKPSQLSGNNTPINNLSPSISPNSCSPNNISPALKPNLLSPPSITSPTTSGHISPNSISPRQSPPVPPRFSLNSSGNSNPRQPPLPPRTYKTDVNINTTNNSPVSTPSESQSVSSETSNGFGCNCNEFSVCGLCSMGDEETLSPSSTSPKYSDANRRTFRQKMLTRKSACLNLSNDTNVDNDDNEPYESTVSATLTTTSLSASTNSNSTTGDDQEENFMNTTASDLGTPTTSSNPESAQTLHSKKKSFFRKDKESVDIKSLLIEKINEQQLSFQKSPDTSSGAVHTNIDQTTLFNKVLSELIETEYDYICDLEITIKLYLFALVEMAKVKLISNQDLACIFSNIEELFIVNKKLYEMLTTILPVIKLNQFPNIEEIFFRNANHFQRYSIYLTNHESSIKCLKALESSNNLVSSILNYIKSLPTVKNLNLSSYLIKPVQRLCKYPLLLRELKKTTPIENDPEEIHQRGFERAAKLTETIVKNINSKISNDEKIQSLIKEYCSKDNDYLLANQIFLKEGKMKMVKDQKKNISDIVILMCNQKLLLIKAKAFSKSIVEIGFHKIINIQPTEKRVNGIDLIYGGEEGREANRIILSCESYSDKLLWIHEIEDNVHAFKVLGGSF
ncbi:hypothetical protein CYY_002252 [Polysphondylium violaceum]|uniref:DH domain-containing protein n=1 Tax=Polysphondylium violaceum TaxID=133409 RepID=A0A8J4Q1X7_9MYCE|nr:hypothetical protein CYY_002252 [Polysphondylium violaceum]